MYVYIKSKPQLWTVGFYAPNGEWIPESKVVAIIQMLTITSIMGKKV